MRKILTVLLIISNLTPINAEASRTVGYVNQKAGQFCKKIEVQKIVKLPDGSKLICIKDGPRARWKAN